MGNHICWTCGEAVSSYSELEGHMESQHKEGEDFIRCPECRKVVSDLFFHWTRYHQNQPLPSGISLRIQKPKDYMTAYKKSQARKNKSRFKQGYFDSPKNSRQMHYRSGFELNVYKILEKSPAVKGYRIEPFPIPYFFSGVKKNYWPDIEVIFTDNTRMLIEVKPLSQCPNADGTTENYTQSQNDAKWQAAVAYCSARNLDFVVWTERAISSLGKSKPIDLTKTMLKEHHEQT